MDAHTHAYMYAIRHVHANIQIQILHECHTQQTCFVIQVLSRDPVISNSSSTVRVSRTFKQKCRTYWNQFWNRIDVATIILFWFDLIWFFSLCSLCLSVCLSACMCAFVCVSLCVCYSGSIGQSYKCFKYTYVLMKRLQGNQHLNEMPPRQ